MKKKRYTSYEKTVYGKFVDLSEMNIFCFKSFFFMRFGRKREFFIFKKPFPMDKTITVDQKWLVDDLDLQFLIITDNRLHAYYIDYTGYTDDKQTPS